MPLSLRASACQSGSAFWPCMLPKPLRRLQGLDIELLPPFALVAALVQLAMVKPAKRHGVFVADFAPERALLRKLKMVCIRWTAAAGEAGLSAHEL
jgi:hypothetical protein